MARFAWKRLPYILAALGCAAILVGAGLAGCWRSSGDGQLGAPDANTDSDADSDTGSDPSADGYAWHTFYGTSEDDHGSHLAADENGNTYVAGASSSSWDGPGGEPPLHAHSGSRDLFALKLDADGAYVWHTFFQPQAGEEEIENLSIAVDEVDNVYVAGISIASWDGPGGEPPLHAHTDGRDLFVLKLDQDGEYAWHTFNGCAGSASLAVDGGGNVYATGASEAAWVGPDGEPPLHAHAESFDYDVINDNSDIYVLKLGPDGAYEWHTFYGSSYDDSGGDLAVDGSGNVYATGASRSNWVGLGDVPPIHAHSESTDDELFVLKLGPDGAYVWHTFPGTDGGGPIAVDGSGSVYVTGSSGPWTGPGGQPPLHACSEIDDDLFVLKLGPGGAYAWHTFYGAEGEGDEPWTYRDYGKSIAVDRSGSVCVTGGSGSSWDGPGGQPPLHAHSGGTLDGPSSDLAILTLEPAGAYSWHTFYGSASVSSMSAGSIAADGAGSVYVTGGSRVSWDGPGGEPPLHAYAGDRDLFVLKHSI